MAMLTNKKINIIDELENFRNENSALKRAVDSKTAAIGILRSELEECQRERDEFRMMAENHPVSQQVLSYKPMPICPEKTPSAILSGSENTLAQLFSLSKEENKKLRLELTDLRCRLHDALSDLKILRAEKSRKTDIHQKRLSVSTSSHLAQQERENLIQQLEHLSSKSQAQETDVRCLLEEREELIKEREENRQKLHRMNHVLNVLLKRHSQNDGTRSHRIVDLDAIITENRYLQQRVKQLDEEKSLALANSSKYKAALETCRIRPNSHSLKIGTTDNLIMSPKQVSEFLKQYEGEVGENVEKDLKYLCVALLDALNQKSRAVKTQKAANRMLVERVADLERRIVRCNTDPNTNSDINLVSMALMEGYNPSSAPSTVENIDVEAIVDEIKNEAYEGNSQTSKCDGKLFQSPNFISGDETGVSKSDRVEENTYNLPNELTSTLNRDLVRDDDVISQETYGKKPLGNIHQSSSDSEEIVPVENLDFYISNLKLKRSMKEPSKVIDDREKSQRIWSEKNHECESSTPSPKGSDKLSRVSDTSFDLDISDYDSDEENLEKTLQNWQNECEMASAGQNIMLKLSPKKSVSGILKGRRPRKDNTVEFPEKLKEILK